jgi:hypothetical protein
MRDDVYVCVCVMTCASAAVFDALSISELALRCYESSQLCSIAVCVSSTVILGPSQGLAGWSLRVVKIRVGRTSLEKKKGYVMAVSAPAPRHHSKYVDFGHQLSIQCLGR